MSDETEGGGDAAPPEDCVIKETGDGETEFHPFDEIEDAYQPGPAMRVMENGLPRTVDQTTVSDIPPLSKDSLICMGDFSRFVIRDVWREEKLSFTPDEVERAPSGKWRVKTETAMARWAPRVSDVPPELQEQRDHNHRDLFRYWVTHEAQVYSDGGWLEVEPVRPPCGHYVQQRTQFKLNAQHSHFARLCSARRTTEGTFMTVGDTGMWACSMREPRDLASEASLDAFDAYKIEEGKHREYLPLFQGAPQNIFDSPKG